MHTPRLCIDGRAAKEYASQGMIAQELIDQLVSAQGDEKAASEWIEKRRTVLLSHPDQVFSGQLKRYDTKRRIGSSFFYQAWEKNFIESAKVSAFHRFRPLDRLRPQLGLPTLTTILPPKRKIPRPWAATENDRYIVPSNQDAALINSLGVDEAQIKIVHPSVRRYIHFVENFQLTQEGWILLLLDHSHSMDYRKLAEILTKRFPHVRHKVLYLKDTQAFDPTDWIETLENTRLCFYLSDLPCDWPFLALEAVFLGIPLIYKDRNGALSPLLNTPELRLSSFLVDHPSLDDITQATQTHRTKLIEAQTLDPLAIARQYRDVYGGLS